MLLTKFVKVGWSNSNRKHYESRGYLYTKNGECFDVAVSDLTHGSNVIVEWACDTCGVTKMCKYRDYNATLRSDGTRYCHRCALRANSAYKKCANAKIRGRLSFLEYHTLNTDSDFEKKYVSSENTVDLNTILPFSHIKFTAKCDDPSHPPYKIGAMNFTNGRRCPYCVSKKVCDANSLGMIFPEAQNLWSVKNNKTPFDYTPYSRGLVYFKCENGVHEDFQRTIATSTKLCFRCPFCSAETTQSVLASGVERWLVANNFPFNKEYNCSLLPISPKTNLPLPYDFEVTDKKVIIEVHGEQHYRITGFHKQHSKRSGFSDEKELFEQQWRDAYKQKYALDHGYLYLVIPYWAQESNLYVSILGDVLL